MAPSRGFSPRKHDVARPASHRHTRALPGTTRAAAGEAQPQLPQTKRGLKQEAPNVTPWG